ncbi:NAD(P)H dehydrogenase [Lysobacteraceae bacterium NML08-0793]|nr:NAD(P)H dehydrogenase [Xanthomonadaceae bacterium NML08-0793]
MKNVLIISGHPNLGESVANRAILDEVAARLPQAQIRKLDALYPDWQIDIAAEQAALQQADIIVWQFPFHWYSLPALMKKWLDEVFVFGFAHGEGAVLGGKKLMVSFTTGAPAAAYARDALMKHAIEDYCAIFESTAILCGLALQPPIYSCGVSYTTRASAEARAAQITQAKAHAARLIAAIEAA